MNSKTKTRSLRVAIIAIALLLCLALAIGITGAFYQAKRQATGTLSMDQGIIIDYKGFNGSETGATWERGTTFELFSTKAGEVQPGAHIKVNPASIKANAKSVNFYARVRLEYKFYNGEAEVTLEDPTVLIKASNLFGSNWEFSSMAAPKDYYYYVENGTTTFKTMVAGADFVELIQSNAEFIIEGEGFKGSDDLEGGGFVVDEATSINKIVVNLVLETLQGDATAEQAKALGWKIAQTVDFSKVDEGKIVTSVNGDPVDEKLNVTINDTTMPLEEVKFAYDEKTILEFDSPNVEYVELTYSDGTKSDKFYELEASETSESKNSQIEVLADETHGSVTGYTVGWFTSKEYTGFVYSNKNYANIKGSDDFYSETNITSQPDNCYSIIKYFGNEKNITINEKARVRQRDFEIVLEGNENNLDNNFKYNLWLWYDMFPITIVESNNTYTNMSELYEAFYNELISKYTKITFKGKLNVQTQSIFYSEKAITQVVPGTFSYRANLFSGEVLNIASGAELITSNFDGIEFSIFGMYTRESVDSIRNKTLKAINIGEGLKKLPKGVFAGLFLLEDLNLPKTLESIGEDAFYDCAALKSITIPQNVKSIGSGAFRHCSNLTTTVGDIGGNWVKASDNTAVDASTLLKDIDYDIKRA